MFLRRGYCGKSKCQNCGKVERHYIEKGETVDQVIINKECSKCGCKGLFNIS